MAGAGEGGGQLSPTMAELLAGAQALAALRRMIVEVGFTFIDLCVIGANPQAAQLILAGCDAHSTYAADNPHHVHMAEAAHQAWRAVAQAIAEEFPNKSRALLAAHNTFVGSTPRGRNGPRLGLVHHMATQAARAAGEGRPIFFQQRTTPANRQAAAAAQAAVLAFLEDRPLEDLA